MTLAPFAQLLDVAWLAAGVLLGAGAMTLRQRLLAWRRARETDWDPY
jgi:hypothetical protein